MTKTRTSLVRKRTPVLKPNELPQNYDSGFQFSNRSLNRMEGINEELRMVSFEALKLTSMDFGVTEGLRSLERQKKLKAKGLSKTLRSKHLTGHAVDVWPYLDGKAVQLKILGEPHIQVAEAFREAAIRVGVDLVWGAAWGRFLHDYDSAEDAYESYVSERRSQGRKPFIDGPHFQLGL